MKLTHFSWTLLVAACSTSCVLDRVPDPLKRTPAGPGATVVFDTEHRPLPEVPLPNDIATFSDPTSRTGLRVNASLMAASSIEEEARQAFAEMEGWGTFMPLTVAFARSESTPETEPALDLQELKARTFRDDHRFEDDPIYLIDLETGVPALLDFGSGELPYVLRDRDLYGPNDPRVLGQNLLLEDHEEGAGLGQSSYRPELDTDFDGVLDHPNTWLQRSTDTAANDGVVDDFLSVYERETDTLMVRPLLALREKREYAVVLTTRLRGSDGRPVKSPFEGVYHPTQVRAAERLQAILGDASRANYYGDIAGGGLDGVAFLWSFTTAPITEDLRLLRDGLYGHGPFARFADEFAPKASMFRTVGKRRDGQAPDPSEATDAQCTSKRDAPYIVRTDDAEFRSSIETVLTTLFNYEDGQVRAIEESLNGTSHVAIGDFASPYLLGDPQHRSKDARFHLDYRSGQGQVAVDRPQFWASIPKPSAEHKQPYPVVLWGHGVGSNGVEALLFGGDFARQGLATVTVQMPLHGLPDIFLARTLLQGQLGKLCYTPLVDAVLKTRVLDLNGDGNGDIAHWWFTLHAATVRDNLRQAALDYLQFVRVLRSFDGVTMSGQDYDGDGREDLAGDFDGDGVPDFGGPNVPVYMAGGSNGGLLTDIVGAVGHEFEGSAPMASGGGLTDIALRSYGIAGPVFQAVSPMLVAVPASERAPGADGVKRSHCTSGSSVRLVYSDGPNPTEMELACLSDQELHGDQTVIVENHRNKEKRCARTDARGRFRIVVPASVDDRLSIRVLSRADAVRSYKGCEELGDADVVRVIDTFEQPEVVARLVPEGSEGCLAAACARAFDRFYDVGSPLLSPQEGFGYERQTPDLRRLFSLAQGLLDGADPVNYARHHVLEPLPLPDGSAGVSRPLLATFTVGDGFVPVSSGHSFARNAGLLPLFAPDAFDRYPEYRDYVMPASLYARFGATAETVLRDHHVTEGVARLARTPVDTASCGVNRREVTGVCAAPPAASPGICRQTLFDVDWFAEGDDGFGAQRLPEPLRLARHARRVGESVDDLEQVWAPRSQAQPFSSNGYVSQTPLAAMGHVYVAPEGAHTWTPPNQCKVFDDATWGNSLNSRFLATGGRDFYPASHPDQQRCLADRSCGYFEATP